jgi:putative tricarboxylic transport membrane protein
MTDRIAGAALIVLGAVVAWVSRGFVVGFPADPVGPRAFPILAAAILALGGVWLLVRPGGDPQWPDRADGLRLVGAAAVLLVYPLVLPFLGFVVTTWGVVTGLSLLFGGPPLKSAGAAFLFAGGLYLLFVHVLGVPLPVGSLFLLGVA